MKNVEQIIKKVTCENTRLSRLNLSHNLLEELSDDILKAKLLSELKLNNNLNLQKLPVNLGHLKYLQKLDLGNTPLLSIADALKKRDGKKAKTLLAKKYAPNIPSWDGYTPLMLASLYGYKEIVQLLLQDKKVDINFQNKIGSALMFAASNGHKEVVALLLENGANIHGKNHHGDTALTSAIKGSKGLLRQNGFWATPKNKGEKGGHCEVVKILLQNNANIHHKDL